MPGDSLHPDIKRPSDLDLSRFCSGLESHLRSLSFECQGAFVSEC